MQLPIRSSSGPSSALPAFRSHGSGLIPSEVDTDPPKPDHERVAGCDRKSGPVLVSASPPSFQTAVPGSGPSHPPTPSAKPLIELNPRIGLGSPDPAGSSALEVCKQDLRAMMDLAVPCSGTAPGPDASQALRKKIDDFAKNAAASDAARDAALLVLSQSYRELNDYWNPEVPAQTPAGAGGMLTLYPVLAWAVYAALEVGSKLDNLNAVLKAIPGARGAPAGDALDLPEVSAKMQCAMLAVRFAGMPPDEGRASAIANACVEATFVGLPQASDLSAGAQGKRAMQRAESMAVALLLEAGQLKPAERKIFAQAMASKLLKADPDILGLVLWMSGRISPPMALSLLDALYLERLDPDQLEEVVLALARSGMDEDLFQPFFDQLVSARGRDAETLEAFATGLVQTAFPDRQKRMSVRSASALDDTRADLPSALFSVLAGTERGRRLQAQRESGAIKAPAGDPAAVRRTGEGKHDRGPDGDQGPAVPTSVAPGVAAASFSQDSLVSSPSSVR